MVLVLMGFNSLRKGGGLRVLAVNLGSELDTASNATGLPRGAYVRSYR